MTLILSTILVGAALAIGSVVALNRLRKLNSPRS